MCGKNQQDNRTVPLAVKQYWSKLAVLALVILLVCATILVMMKNRPAEYVLPKLDEVNAVYIYSLKGYAGYDMAQLSEEDQATLFSAIENVSLHKRSAHSPTEMVGGKLWMFRFEYADGSHLDFAASLPLYILDGTLGFDADFDGNSSICSHISKTYYSLVEKYFG